MRALLLLALLAVLGFGWDYGLTSGGARSDQPDSRLVVRPIVYGDSRWDASSDRFDCDLCGLASWPGWVRMDSNFSRAGGRMIASSACTNLADPDVDPAGTDCLYLLDRAVYQSSGLQSGACGFQPDSYWLGSTCIADQTASAAVDVLVVDMGINDVRQQADADDAGWATELATMTSSLTATLAANAARATPFACVLTVPAPTYSNLSSPAISYTVANARIDGDVRDMVTTLATTYGCEVADLFSAVDDLPTDTRRGAVYAACAPPFGQTQNAPTVDCVHYATSGTGPDPIIAELARALAAAGGGGGSGGGAVAPEESGSSLWDTMVWDTDDWG